MLSIQQAKLILGDFNNEKYAIKTSQNKIELRDSNHLKTKETLLAVSNAFGAHKFGSKEFKEDYGLKYAYHMGAMANGIASEKMVISAANNGYLASFGAAGLTTKKVEEAIVAIKAAVGKNSFAVNLIHSPSEPLLEQNSVYLFLKYGVNIVEASAFLDLTINIVKYRVCGLVKDKLGNITAKNKVIVKISRKEVAEKFMQPAPLSILEELLTNNEITKEQFEFAQKYPMADDVTVEADSGGHTDNRPLLVLLPSIITLKNQIQAQYNYTKKIRIGAAGGIGTPQAVLAAFAMGAAYIVTGSINQACLEAGTSAQVKELLAKVSYADVMMAPAADMFELGVNLQVLKKGTLFGMRAKKLYELYKSYESIEDIPLHEKQKIESQIFQNKLEFIWEQCQLFFNERDPEQIIRANNNSKRKMALIFRWYLGLSSQWAKSNTPNRAMDFQIWCGPAMGAFNDWTKDSPLEHPQNRNVCDVAKAILEEAAILFRLNQLETQGISF